MVMRLLRYKKMVLKQYALTVGLKHNLAMKFHLIKGLNLIEKPYGFIVKCTILEWVTTTTNRGLASTGLAVLSPTAVGLDSGSVATGSITVLEVIDDCMSPQCTDSSEDETEPPTTHGTRSPTSKSLTKIQSKKSAMDSSFTLGSTEEADNIKILQSCNGLLLIAVREHYDIGSREFIIYEMMKGCSVWSVRYRVDTDDFMTLLPEGWSIWSTVWSIVLGEREEDYFLVINLSGKVVQYNLISKTLYEIYDCRSNQLDDNHDDDDELLQQFKAEHNVYEFIQSFASSIPINRGLIQAIPTSLPPQPIGEATKASNLQRIPPGV
ncbi:hypothetical protein Tco_0953785 [Tanacetum coccineum]|uniref:Uncharacterized protein n=1 Tax=Tanacetum coccineum TaxID=301880 RepID=A0ABQ5E0Y3_9ASTR